MTVSLMLDEVRKVLDYLKPFIRTTELLQFDLMTVDPKIMEICSNFLEGKTVSEMTVLTFMRTPKTINLEVCIQPHRCNDVLYFIVFNFLV